MAFLVVLLLVVGLLLLVGLLVAVLPPVLPLAADLLPVLLLLQADGLLPQTSYG